jgi:hypothetical protein
MLNSHRSPNRRGGSRSLARSHAPAVGFACTLCCGGIVMLFLTVRSFAVCRVLRNSSRNEVLSWFLWRGNPAASNWFNIAGWIFIWKLKPFTSQCYSIELKIQLEPERACSGCGVMTEEPQPHKKFSAGVIGRGRACSSFSLSFCAWSIMFV